MFQCYDSNTSIKNKNDTPSIGTMYSKIIELTYSSDPHMFSAIEDEIASQIGQRAFNQNLLITINRFGRLDTTIPLIRNQLPVSDYSDRSDSYLDSASGVSKYDTSFDDELNKLNNMIESDLNQMTDNITSVEYQSFDLDLGTVKRLSRVVRRVSTHHLNQITTDGSIDLRKLNNYSKYIVRCLSQYDLDTRSERIFVDLWALSLITPLHTWILDVTLRTVDQNGIQFVLGEHDKTEIEFLCFRTVNIKEFITTEYTSHAMLFVLNDRYIYAYDPDDKNVFEPGSTVLNRSYVSCEIDLPIQVVTDDIYCIFHSIFGMLDMVIIGCSPDQSDQSEPGLLSMIRRFEKYQNSINRMNEGRLTRMVGSRIGNLIQRYPVRKTKIY
jgi:hypothetical protein